MSDSFRMELTEKVAELLGVTPTSLNPTEELADHGLDSVRMMEVLEWARSRGWDADYADLLEDTTLDAWVDLFQPTSEE